MKNLKPVIFIDGKIDYYRENQYAQNLLLKALSEGVTDPHELKKLAGLRTVTEVYRTLDKMQIRKEYHAALGRAGISLDYLVEKLQKLCEGDAADKIKLGAIQTILKSIGLEKYDKVEEGGKNWEELVMELSSEKKKEELIEGEFKEYEVKHPELPESARKKQAEEKSAADELYGG